MDTQDAPRWMTYVEFGKLIDGSPEAARQLAIRLRLRKQRDNDGRVQVWVDPDAVSHRNTRRTPVQTGVQHPVHTPVQTNEINALQDHVKTLQERLQAADKAMAELRADHAAEVQRLERQAAAADARADEERVARADAESRADVERARLRADHAAEIERLEQQMLVAEVRAGHAEARTNVVLNEVRALRAEMARSWWRKLFRL